MERQPPIINRIYDVSKHWWGMRIVEHGYNGALSCTKP